MTRWQKKRQNTAMDKLKAYIDVHPNPHRTAQILLAALLESELRALKAEIDGTRPQTYDVDLPEPQNPYAFPRLPR